MRIEVHPESELGALLAARVAADLRAAIAANGRASIAVPGGTTPAPFLSALAGENLDWRQVTVTVTDERQVPPDSPRSNQRLVAEHLLLARAAGAVFVPLFAPGLTVDALEAKVAASVVPLSVVVLGMGTDMHTASLFPGTPGLAELLDSDGARLVGALEPPGADEPRITLSLRALSTAAHTYLLINGADKRAALDRALSADHHLSAPVRAVLDAARRPVIFTTH